MTYNEFSQRDLELKKEINEYRRNSFNAQQQIIANEIEITRLEDERSKLHFIYAKDEMSK